MNKCLINEKEIVWRIIDRQAVIIKLNKPLHSDNIYTFNETGTVIWEMLVKGLSLEKIIKKLCEKFDVEAKTAFLHAKKFLNLLKKNSLIRP